MKRLSLSEITGIAEIVGSIGIIVSLIFVGLQVRQNTNQIEANSVEAGYSFFQALNDLTSSPETSDVVLKGIDDFDALSKAEKARFNGALLNITTKFFMARQFYLQGSLTRKDYDTYEDGLARLMLSPGVITWWAQARRLVNSDGRKVIDDIVERYHDIQPISDFFNFTPTDHGAAGGAE